jgi:hypothetical protein
MRQILTLVLLLPLGCFAQDAALTKIFPMSKGKVHYDTSFLMQTVKDTVFERTRNWVTAEPGYQKNLSMTRLHDDNWNPWKEFLKCTITFPLPFTPTSKQLKATAPQLVYQYTLRVYVIKDYKAQVIIDELSMIGNLDMMGLKLPEGKKDTLNVEDYKTIQQSIKPAKAANATKERLTVYSNYRKADAYIRKHLLELVTLLQQKMEFSELTSPVANSNEKE